MGHKKPASELRAALAQEVERSNLAISGPIPGPRSERCSTVLSERDLTPNCSRRAGRKPCMAALFAVGVRVCVSLNR